MAAYVASQIGQTAQVRADHGMSHRVARRAAVRPSGPPPEGARVRMKKGLHLAMKAQIADKPSPSGGFLFFNGVMLKTPMPTQHELEMVTLEELVPKD
ncbi:hypothetical protein, partial [Burkholderia mallei]|uniref:hypothetical protein n=1 Tax=Burkholderia mallei TaxID=13373 RepID=UPI0023620BA7